MTEGDFQGRVAVVAGGTQGLGEATARLLVERGATGLVLLGRSVDKGEALAAELGSDACRTLFIDTDLSDVASCRSVMPAVEAEFGSVHGLANIAAMTGRGNVWSTTPELWDDMLATNVRGPFLLSQAAAELMKRTGTPGSIVNIGSVCGDGGPPNLLPYSVSKGALQTLTKNMAFALAPLRIRVNLIQLGWMDTPAEHIVQQEQEGQPSDWLERAAAAQPFGRLIDPDEAARAICYLLSDESGLMTGATLDFDQTVVGAGAAPNPGPRETTP